MAHAEGGRWHQRAHHALRHSLKRRLVAVFLILALALAAAFVFGMQNALSSGWRYAARPLVVDYVDRMVSEIGAPPSVEKAKALAQRLPLSVRISGPKINWRSHPQEQDRHWQRDGWMDDGGDHQSPRLLARTTADGHRIEFGLNPQIWRDRPRFIGWATLGVLLLFTLMAYAYVRRLLRPLDDIGAGTRRFGSGDFSSPIAVTRKDELGQLAVDVNGMASSIHGMLEAKRSLLLAISHELRSPLTRARVNTELLPQTPERSALLRDLAEMRDLVTDLLESERLGAGHAALHTQASDPGEFVREVAQALAPQARLDIAPGLPELPLDHTRMRLLMRNLLDNAARHSPDAAQVPVIAVHAKVGAVVLSVRDFGPGVPEEFLSRLAEPFFRPDASRERATGGVGLGLHLCQLVAQAHGGSFALRNAQPGLEALVTLPVS